MSIRKGALPIGLLLGQTGKIVSRAFDAALATGGGTLPDWLVLLALVQGDHEMQADVAAAIGIRGPTLTHHLDRMEKEGLLTRTRPPNNRRVQCLALTEAGRARFARLRKAAIAFDARLRTSLEPDDLDRLRDLLARLVGNATRI